MSTLFSDTDEQFIHALHVDDEGFTTFQHFFSHPSTFIEFALDSILSAVHAHAGSLFLWDEQKKVLILKCARGPYTERIRDIHVKLSEGVSGFVGEKGRSVLVKDIHEDERFNGLERLGSYDTYSFISVPLISNNKLLGVINITEKSDFTAFTESDLNQARIFAQYVAIAYENMRLNQRLKAENVRLHQEAGEIENTLRSQETLVMIGKLASNLAHELNNPLDSIRRYVNLALDQAPENSLTREYLLKAKSGIRRAVRVIRGLLQFFRECNSAKVNDSELHTLIDSTLESLIQDENYGQIEIIRNFYGLPVWFSDHGCYVVLRNLFKNAYQAMSGKGTLTVTTALNGKFVFVKIRDTGCGMPEHVLRRQFEPFFSTKKEEGTGIGLTISKEIIEKCGGTIEAHSEVGAGTEFTLKLPYRKISNHG